MNGYGTSPPLPRAADWAALRRGLAGELLLPDEHGYETARHPAVPGTALPHPSAVLRCGTENDVSEALRFAARRGLPAHVRAGGHSPAGFSTGPGLVLDLTALDTVHTDGNRVSCGAGTRTGALAEVLDTHRRMVPLGQNPDVGIAGHTLGGGTGSTGRRYGFTLDSLLSARVVLSDGTALDCDDRRHPELFWALRGGGPLVPGVVTSLCFRTRPELPVTDFLLGWPADCRAQVLLAWQEWAPYAPDELTSTVELTAGESWDGLHPATVGGSWLGAREDLERRLADLVAAVGRCPDTHTTASHGPRASLRFWSAPPGGGALPGVRRHEFFGRTLPGSTARELIRVLERGLRPGERRHCDFQALGGAYNRVAARATALVHRDHLFGMLSRFGPAPGESYRPATAAAHDRLHALVRPWVSGHACQNHPEAGRPDWGHTYYGANHQRLAAARARYDPGGTFAAPFTEPPVLPFTEPTEPADPRAEPVRPARTEPQRQLS